MTKAMVTGKKENKGMNGTNTTQIDCPEFGNSLDAEAGQEKPPTELGSRAQ